MHELSIAEALREQVKAHTPAGSRVVRVNVLIGPMQGVEPDSLRFGWEAVCRESGLDGAGVPELVLEMPPFQLKCQECGRAWESRDMYVACECGSAIPLVSGGDELRLTSIDVEDIAK